MPGSLNGEAASAVKLPRIGTGAGSSPTHGLSSSRRPRSLSARALSVSAPPSISGALEGLPPADLGIDEAAYNLKAAEALDAICLDRTLVFDDGPDRMEICDVLTRTGGMIHVKHSKSRSP